MLKSFGTTAILCAMSLIVSAATPVGINFRTVDLFNASDAAASVLQRPFASRLRAPLRNDARVRRSGSFTSSSVITPSLISRLRINRAHAGMRFHARVHQRLRVAGFVSFVMTKPAKTDQIEHDVFVELLPVIERDLQRAIRCFRIVAVDVKDRQLRHARDVS